MGRTIRYPRVAFISGASAGFGEAIALRLIGQGVRVIAAARRLEKLEALAAEAGGLLLPLALDIRDVEAIERAVASLPPDFSQVDCLINNAGLALGLEPAPRANVADWVSMIATNCTGLVSLTRALLPGMVERGDGNIVNMGSVAGSYPYPGGNVYGATKAFVHQFSLNLRSDLHGTGVKVTCLEPGMCGGTEFSEVRFAGDSSKARAVYAGMTPLSAEDIADLVEWIVTRPPHVNLNTIEVMPVAQSWAPFAVHRESA